MGDPQVNLNNAFPGASTGDAVIDELTNDTWIYNGSLWVNNGPNPGDYLEEPALLATSNEVVSVSSIINITFGPRGLAYSTSLLSELTPTGINIGVNISSIRAKIDLDGNTQIVNINIFTPLFGNGVGVFVPAPVLVAVVGLEPADIKANIQVQARVNISLLRFVPYIYTAVNYPGLNIVINKFAPYISTPVNASTVSFQVAGFIPDAVGAPLEIPSTQVEIAPILPSFVGGAVPPAMVYIVAYSPGIRVGLVVPLTVISLSASVPDIGSLLVAPGITVSVNKFTPTVSALPSVHVLFDHVHVLINSGAVGYDISNKAAWIATASSGSESWNGSLGPNGNISSQNSVTKFNPTSIRIGPVPVGGVRTNYYYNSSYSASYLYGHMVEFWFRADTSSFVANTPKRILGSVYIDGNTTRQMGTVAITGPTTGATLSFDFLEQNSATGAYTSRVAQSQANVILPNTWYHVFIDMLTLGPHTEFGGTSADQRIQVTVAVNGVWGTSVTNTTDGTRIVMDVNFYTYFGNSDTVSNANDFTGYIDDFRKMGYIRADGRYGINTFANSIAYPLTPYNRAPTPFTPPTRALPRYGVETETYRWLINNYKRSSSTPLKWWYGSYNQTDPVWIAVDGFVKDCKTAGIWNDILYCLPLVGRDVVNSSSLMFPLKDPTWDPTAVNDGLNIIPADAALPSLSGTVSYSRNLGLLGNGTNFYIDMKRLASTVGLPSDSHVSAYVTDMQTGVVLSAGYLQSGSLYLDAVPGLGGTRHGMKTATLTRSGTDAISLTEGFFGLSRSSSSEYQYSVPGSSGTISSSESTGTSPLYFLARKEAGGTIDAYGAHRAVIITYGTAINLTLLQQCSTALAARLKSIP